MSHPRPAAIRAPIAGRAGHGLGLLADLVLVDGLAFAPLDTMGTKLRFVAAAYKAVIARDHVALALRLGDRRS